MEYCSWIHLSIKIYVCNFITVHVTSSYISNEPWCSSLGSSFMISSFILGSSSNILPIIIIDSIEGASPAPPPCTFINSCMSTKKMGRGPSAAKASAIK